MKNEKGFKKNESMRQSDDNQCNLSFHFDCKRFPVENILKDFIKTKHSLIVIIY